ncbi:hypothetical protein ARALYDRAFT_890047 [Arabidopsis lyrata subsp. lyrata]|uniref:F-box/LRR-repeat protein 15/At3g58940/PEG3-like LRR domain-containing protein n=1 Tax=Arabidopsis lyrata subsp. lyrata TaxID=81972 RepID=D7KQL2_ARALL|nr:hypothetical protein ARALYDRAFT_890047 [Arabidopsis lyrata subsp. lyrata]
MVPRLEFKDEGSESVGWFIEKSLQLHKAPKLDGLIVEIGPHCPFDVDVGKWVENAVNRDVEDLDFKLLWTAEPTRFPKCLYTCDTLVYLTLSNQILVDVSSPASLPSLLYLSLHYVVYKDDGSLVRLLSSSPILKWLSVHRHENDNLKTFTVKVSSLESFYYDDNWLKNEVEDNEIDEVEVDAVEDNEVDEVVDNEVEVDEDDDLNGSLVIDSPALKNLQLYEVWDYCLIENMSFLDEAFINNVPNPDDKFLRSLSSVIHLYLYLTKSMVAITYPRSSSLFHVVACCNAIKFSRLIELHFHPDDLVDWLMPLIFLLQNSPQLKTLTIDNWVENAVNRGVKYLDFKLLWTADPTSYPKSLYTCDTLVSLTLSNQILVDVSSPASLPSLLYLGLHYVVYKDEDSLVRLLSSSPILKWLCVHRHEDDNLKTFTVKVSSLESLYYDENNEVDEVVDNEVEFDEDDDLNGSLVIDSPALKILNLYEVWDYCLIENMSFLDVAFISNVPYPDDKFLRSLSSVIHLYLLFTKSMVACCSAIEFSRLIEFYFLPDSLVDWLMPLMFLLQNSPKLKTLTIDNTVEISLLAT